MCDGSNESKSCAQIEGASSCSDGKVAECKKNFELAEDKTACEINKAQGACGLGCIIGVFVSVVAVISVVIAVFLLLFFKNQRAKIDELMFRSVGSTSENSYNKVIGGLRNVSGRGSVVGNRGSAVLGEARDSGEITLRRKSGVQGHAVDLRSQRLAI